MISHTTQAPLQPHVAFIVKLDYHATYKLLLALDDKRGAHNNNLTAIEQDQFGYLANWYATTHNGA